MSASSTERVVVPLSLRWTAGHSIFYDALVVISTVLAVLFASRAYKVIKSPLRDIPGPWYAKWTNLRLKWAVLSGDRMYYIHSLHEKYGPYVLISPDEVAVLDAEGFNQIHRVGTAFGKSKWYSNFVSVGRPILFTMRDRKAHAQRRKLFSRNFSKASLRENWEPIVHDFVRTAVAGMKADSVRGTTDVLKWWMLLTNDVSSKLSFGQEFGTLAKGDFTEHVLAAKASARRGGINAELPWIRTIGKMIPLKFMQQVFNAASQTEMSQQGLAFGKGNNHTLLSNIIQGAEKGEQLDEEDTIGEARSFITAGTDTTAMTLTYLVWAVLSHPEWKQRLGEEVSRLPDDFDEAQTEALPVLNAVIDETMRLYSAAPGSLPREVPAGGVTMGQHFIPGGFTVSTQAYSYHRDAKYFPNPTKFDPSRFMPDGDFNTRLSTTSQAIYHPFGAGSRACLGMHIAKMELRVGAAEFFRNCRGAQLAPSTTPESMVMKNYFLISPTSGKCEITI